MKRPGAVLFIFVTVAIDMMGIGIIAPVFPKLVMQLTGGDASQASALFGIFGSIFALMQLVFAPILGMLSDRYGRRRVILLSCAGLAVDYFIMALAPTIGWLFIGRVLSGMTSASFATAYAYIADVTEPEKRAGAFGTIGAAFGFGFILGPIVGGLLGNGDPRLPFWVAGALSLVNALYGMFVLPESLKEEHRQATIDWKRANPLGALRLLNSHPELRQLATISFIGYIAHEALPTMFVLYTIYRYAWTPGANGTALTFVGLCSMLVSFTTGWFVKRLGSRLTLLLGLTFALAGFLIMAGASSGVWFVAGIPFICLWGIYGPAVQDLMTRRVSESVQGELQGALGSMRSVAALIGPGAFAWTFAAFIGRWNVPGAPWFLAAILMICSLAVAVKTARAMQAASTERAVA